MSEDNYVLIAVPANLVPQIAKLIAGVERQPEPKPANSASWDEAHATRLYQESSKNQRAILKFLADHGGEEVTTEAIAAGARIDPGSLPGTLGALGRRCPSRYQLPTPWERRWDADGHAVMKLPVEVAEVIQRMAKQ